MTWPPGLTWGSWPPFSAMTFWVPLSMSLGPAPTVSPTVLRWSPRKRVASCWKGLRRVPSRGVAVLMPMALPLPPMSPVAPVMAAWPDTSSAASMAEVRKTALNDILAVEEMGLWKDGKRRPTIFG
ncbi:hypothetical protein CDD83_9913 [Cordyceps sp. RAO-2017]|nr:hypothetical protein CDD83_9913 [Cordyceps sp. RAO-2017]